MQSKTVYTSYYSLADKHKGKVTMSVINTHFIMASHGGINILGSHANMQATRGPPLCTKPCVLGQRRMETHNPRGGGFLKR